MTRALDQVPAAARDHIAATLHTHLNAAAERETADGPRITEADANAAAAAVVLALRADGWHITAPTRHRRP
ncbi:hypothetical protein ACWFRQ_17790 [Streptomyces niveus]